MLYRGPATRLAATAGVHASATWPAVTGLAGGCTADGGIAEDGIGAGESRSQWEER
jgi:hypothetical protein